MSANMVSPPAGYNVIAGSNAAVNGSGAVVVWTGSTWVAQAVAGQTASCNALNNIPLARQPIPSGARYAQSAPAGNSCDLLSSPEAAKYTPIQPIGAFQIPSVVQKMNIPRQRATVSKTFSFSPLLKAGDTYAVIGPSGDFSVIQQNSCIAAPTDIINICDYGEVLVDIFTAQAFVFRCGQLLQISGTDLSENPVTVPVSALQYAYVDTETGALFTIPLNPPQSSFEQLFSPPGTSEQPTVVNGLNPQLVLGLPCGGSGFPPITFLTNFQISAELAGSSVAAFVLLGIDAQNGIPAGVGYLLGSDIGSTPEESGIGTHIFSDGTVAGMLGPKLWVTSQTLTGAVAGGTMTVALYAQVLNGQGVPLAGQNVQWTVTAVSGDGSQFPSSPQSIGAQQLTNSLGIAAVPLASKGSEGTVFSGGAGATFKVSTAVGVKSTWSMQVIVNGKLFPSPIIALSSST